MFGAPLEGAMLDGAAAFETGDWLEHRGARLEQPWLLVSSLINPHDIMFLRTDPFEEPLPEDGLSGALQPAEIMGAYLARARVPSGRVLFGERFGDRRKAFERIAAARSRGGYRSAAQPVRYVRHRCRWTPVSRPVP